MEPEVRLFLLKVAKTISTILLWMLINTVFGLGYNYAFFENKPGMGNIVFYIWFILSFAALIVFLRKQWKGEMNA
jgi:hypothetical protein